MDWMEALKDLNYWSILAATASSFLVGYIWYNWSVFGASWATHVGLKKKDLQKPEGMGKTFLMTGVGSFIAASVLAALLLATNTTSVSDSMIFGFVLGFGLRLSAHVMHNGFAMRSQQLSLIDGVHDALQLAVMGGVMAALL